MYLMVGVVANHVGPVGNDYSTIVPFNDSKFYHTCAGCPDSCFIVDFTNQFQVENCRLAGLPDLNQENPVVLNELIRWAADLVKTYSLDGVRIDTVPEVPKQFWAKFQQALNVYAVGEVFNGDVGYVADYQQVLDGLLSYPLFFALRDCFASKQSLYRLQDMLQRYSTFKDTTVLGTFIDNHDNPRFLSAQSDVWLYRNALTYTLMGEGIPIVYYGTEQGFSGGGDPANREPLWTSGYSTDSDLYKLIGTLLNLRKAKSLWKYPQVQRYADDNFYAFTRGQAFVALTNEGQTSQGISRNITYHPYPDNTKLCNVFWPVADCIVVQGGQFTVTLIHGESKVYVPV